MNPNSTLALSAVALGLPTAGFLVNAHGQVQTLGEQLFTTFLLPFELTSLLLLVAAVGAVYLSRHRRAGE